MVSSCAYCESLQVQAGLGQPPLIHTMNKKQSLEIKIGMGDQAHSLQSHRANNTALHHVHLDCHTAKTPAHDQTMRRQRSLCTSCRTFSRCPEPARVHCCPNALNGDLPCETPAPRPKPPRHLRHPGRGSTSGSCCGFM